MLDRIYFHERQPREGDPGGVTVTKRGKLPVGDFQLNDSKWPALLGLGDITMWFVSQDEFTPEEREQAFEVMLEDPELIALAKTVTTKGVNQ